MPQRPPQPSWERQLEPHFSVTVAGSKSTATLTDRMRQLSVPGVSYAVIENGAVATIRAVGLSGNRSAGVTPATLFNANSVSKSATGVLFAYLHQLGRIDLDRSVNEYFKELGSPFRLREGTRIAESVFAGTACESQAKEIVEQLRANRLVNEDGFLSPSFQPSALGCCQGSLAPLIPEMAAVLARAQQSESRPECTRTLRQLLSHTAGVSVHGVCGFAPGTVATKEQILAGTTSMGRVEVIYNPATPDGTTAFHYSGGGYVVAEYLLEGLLQSSFEHIARTFVFNPLGMDHSTFRQSAGDSVTINGRTLAKAAGHGLAGERVERGFVWSAKSMAALWTTPEDHGRLLGEIHSALAGHGKLLTRESAEAILRGTGVDDRKYRVGLGVMAGHDGIIRHSGANPGYRSYFAMDARGNGIAAFTNGERGDAIIDELARGVSRSQGSVWAEVLMPQGGQFEHDCEPRELGPLCGVYGPPNTPPTYEFSIKDAALHLTVRNGATIYDESALIAVECPNREHGDSVVFAKNTPPYLLVEFAGATVTVSGDINTKLSRQVAVVQGSAVSDQETELV